MRNDMAIALVIVSILCVLLFLRLLLLKRQLFRIRRQQERRAEEKAENLIYLEVRERNLNELTRLLNMTIKRESALRAKQELKEREFQGLITNISHDLRTPLTVMKGYLQLLSRSPLQEDAKEYLAVCFRHTEELEGRIRQFFEYSYYSAQDEEILCSLINISNLVTEVMTDFIPVFEEHALTMNLAQDTNQKAWGNEELIKRMIQNLMKNCVQYAVGEVAVVIAREQKQFSESNQGGRIVVSVQNRVREGVKFDESHVFSRFYAGSPASGRSTGLGLSIVKLLAEKMGGEVFAEKKGEYFTVGFFLPGAPE